MIFCLPLGDLYLCVANLRPCGSSINFPSLAGHRGNQKEETDLAPACQSTEGQRDLKTPINIYFLETAYT